MSSQEEQKEKGTELVKQILLKDCETIAHRASVLSVVVVLNGPDLREEAEEIEKIVGKAREKIEKFYREMHH